MYTILIILALASVKKACELDFYNKCKENDECCSKYCEKPSNWMYGVCKQPEEEAKLIVKNCEADWFNECTDNGQCCSKNCEKPPEWLQGVCKPATNSGKACKQLYEVGCTTGQCCPDLICSKGPLSNWKKGLCIANETQPITVSKSPDIDDDDDDFGDYLDFVRDHLFAKHNLTLESRKLKCRELDPFGEYFYKFNRSHSFRICDACAEFPFEKLPNVKIALPPLDQQSPISFPECFEFCTTATKCVAYSYKQAERLCLIFDHIQGEYDDDDEWSTVVLTQPVEVLRDYVYSRHTEVVCEEDVEKAVFRVDSIMECFSKCEQLECQVAVYANDTCTLHTNGDHCYNVYYKYGYVSLFYQAYFTPDNNDWRFVRKGPNDDDDDDDDVVEASKENYAKSRVVSEVSKQNLKHLKAIETKNRLAACFDDCIKTALCTGVLFDRNSTGCELIDWSSENTADLEVTDVEYTLVHPLRTSPLYAYTLHYNTLPTIKYSSQHELNLPNCLKKCNISVDCIEIYTKQGSCLLINDSPGTKTAQIGDDWLNWRKSRARFNQPNFQFTLIQQNEYLSNEMDRFLIETINVDAKHQCFDKCQTNNSCDLLQMYRTSAHIECKLYGEMNDTWHVTNDTKSSSEWYIRTFTARFDLAHLDAMPLFSSEDADACQPDKEAIIGDLYYLYYHSKTTNKASLGRPKRGLGDKIGSFFKGVGEDLLNLGKKVVDTAGGLAKGAVKLVQGDAKGAWEEVKKAPLVEDVGELVENVKDIGEGIGEGFKTGDFSQAGKGLLGVVTNDVVGLIPLPGFKGVQTGIKAGTKAGLKTGVKETAKSTKKQFRNELKDLKGKFKREKRSNKKELSKKNKQKNKKKEKKDKEKEKKKNCKVKKRPKRASIGAGRGKKQSCDDDCSRPVTPAGMRGKLLAKTTKSCKDTKSGEFCNYLCNAGYDERPNQIKCNGGTWDQRMDCVPQQCGNGVIRVIFVKSAFSLYKIAKNSEALLYAVLYNTATKLPIWSITYHKWQIVRIKDGDRAGHFVQHPCKDLNQKQLADADYKKKHNSKGYHKGHLSPADLYRWNDKSKNSANLYINIVPQGQKLNIGSWKTLEREVGCASKNRISAIVATGTGGAIIDHIGRNQQTPVYEYMFKLVCYKYAGKSHVALFLGQNEHVPTETKAMKRFTLTARDQQDLIAIMPELANPVRTPWWTAAEMAVKDRFTTIGRFPTPVECSTSPRLDDEQKQLWREQFSVFGDGSDDDDDDAMDMRRRRKRATNGPFCTKKELKDYSSWLKSIGSLDDDQAVDADSIDDDDDDDDVDEGEVTNIKDIPATGCGKLIVGYYPSWGDHKITLATLSKFTHIIFAFFEMLPDGRVVIGNPDHSSAQTSSDKDVTDKAKMKLKRLLDMKEKLPGLKVTFAVGGWENSQYFSRMAANQEMKNVFFASVLRNIEDYGFDGIDIDWEYPVTGGATEGITQDKQNYVLMMSELRYLLNKQSSKLKRSKYLISFASAAGETALNVGYDLPGLLKSADWVNVMTYDYFGPWASKWGGYTGPIAPLYHGVPKGYSGKFNVNWSIKQYVCKLESPAKVVLGLPLYGRFWYNVPPKSGKYAMYRMAKETGGKFDGGFVTWRDIKHKWLKNSGFEHHFDKVVKSPYAYHSNGTYLGYESPESIRHKIAFAKEKHLGGLMVWAIDQDDETLSMIKTISSADICPRSDKVEFKCVPIDEKRWWTLADGDKMAGLCGRSAPLYKGYYPVCDPDDLGYSCCGKFGFCGSGDDFCDCPTCVDYATNPEKILEMPIKPTSGRITWHLSNAADGSRGRCGREVPKVGREFATCNADDGSANCCSAGGYCGIGKTHCECSGCVNFKKKPNYKFPPKTWWGWEDGKEKSGKCGPKAPKLDGKEAGCNPDSEDYCCSMHGFCGKGAENCDCKGCKNYRK